MEVLTEGPSKIGIAIALFVASVFLAKNDSIAHLPAVCGGIILGHSNDDSEFTRNFQLVLPGHGNDKGSFFDGNVLVNWLVYFDFSIGAFLEIDLVVSSLTCDTEENE